MNDCDAHSVSQLWGRGGDVADSVREAHYSNESILFRFSLFKIKVALVNSMCSVMTIYNSDSSHDLSCHIITRFNSYFFLFLNVLF